MRIDINHLIDNQADPDARAVLEDLRLSNGERVTRLGVALWMVNRTAAAAYDDAAAAYDDAADAAAAYADADAADADDADDAYADADDADDADADDADDAADRSRSITSGFTNQLYGDIDMRDGLKIIQVTGAYYGYAVTRVGYLRRISGDEYELLPGARTIIRTSSGYGLDGLASKGPSKDYKLMPASEGPEEIHRLLLRRALPCDEKVWSKHVERPGDWKSEAA